MVIFLSLVEILLNSFNEILYMALVGVAQWIECWPANQRGHWLNSQSGHMPGPGARSPVGGAQEATTH